jgi:RNA polymerase-interacting CarD/CdnL/TRCF family regulator
MNIQSKINKLILALRTKGRIVRINTEQFYAEDSGRMITKYKIGEVSEAAEADQRVIKALYKKLNSKKTPEEEKESLIDEIELLEEEYSENYISGTFYSKIKILTFLAEWYKKVGEET